VSFASALKRESSLVDTLDRDRIRRTSSIMRSKTYAGANTNITYLKVGSGSQFAADGLYLLPGAPAASHPCLTANGTLGSNTAAHRLTLLRWKLSGTKTNPGQL
jgi:hypothetical protein